MMSPLSRRSATATFTTVAVLLLLPGSLVVQSGCARPAATDSPPAARGEVPTVSALSEAPSSSSAGRPSASPLAALPRTVRWVRLVRRWMVSSDLDDRVVAVLSASELPALFQSIGIDQTPSKACPVCVPSQLLEMLGADGTVLATLGMPCPGEGAMLLLAPGGCQSLTLADEQGLRALFAARVPPAPEPPR